MSHDLIGAAERRRIALWQADLIDLIGPSLRAIIHYMHDGTQECQEIILGLCRRHHEPDLVLQGVLLYYLELSASKAARADDAEEARLARELAKR
jgi:hypothetical protein